jgi:hypothetical protein
MRRKPTPPSHSELDLASVADELEHTAQSLLDLVTRLRAKDTEPSTVIETDHDQCVP